MERRIDSSNWRIIGIATMLAASQALSAHEKWFADGTAHPTRWEQIFRFPQLDRLLFPTIEPSARVSRLAMPCLRIGLGLGLAVVAFTEKLANPDLARTFLQGYPLNFTGWLNVPMSNDMFVVCAGSAELLIGLCLIFGIFPRLIVAIAWPLINMTLTVFNWVELVGHLPMYGVMAILLVWTPREEDDRLWIEGVLGRQR